MIDAAAKIPAPFHVRRRFHAPRRFVFEAWSSADHVKRWFAPSGFTVPEAKVELKPGGPFDVLMRSPAGEEHWARGVVKEVSPYDRLAIDFTVEDAKGRPLFRALTEVNFSDALGESVLDATQTYALLEPEAARMTEGAPQGWAQTLDKLAAEARRMQAPEAAPGSVVHAAFTVTRTYDAPVERVWRALSNAEAKAQWFGGLPGGQEIERSMDFRVGGAERAKGRLTSGVVSTFGAVYHDIVPNARLVYSYVMHLDDRKISVSLATMELKAEGPSRTSLKVTEQGAFLDGYDDAGSRQRGTGFLLDKLGASLG